MIYINDKTISDLDHQLYLAVLEEQEKLTTRVNACNEWLLLFEGNMLDLPKIGIDYIEFKLF